MNATALIAEYLVIGFQTLIYLTLFIFKIEDISTKEFLNLIAPDKFSKEEWALCSILILIAAYTLGMLMDTIWFLLTHKVRKKSVRNLWQKYERQFVASPKSYQLFYTIENKIYGEEGLRERIHRRRGRIRILRASVFNVALITVSILVNEFTLWILLLGTIIEILTFVAYVAVNREYIRMLVYYQ